MRRAVNLFLWMAAAASGCAASLRATPVGAQHSPYAGLPAYMESLSRQRYDELVKNRAARLDIAPTAPIHLPAPSAAGGLQAPVVGSDPADATPEP